MSVEGKNMNWFIDLITNPFVITPISSWIVAQIVKSIIFVIINKKFDIKRLMGDGGMPSGHSATVMSLTVLTGIVYGCGSWNFAISAILTLIVGHDAMGVRREVGKHSSVLNEIISTFETIGKKEPFDIKLNELAGHTPLQVWMGGLLGAANAVVMYFLLF